MELRKAQCYELLKNLYPKKSFVVWKMSNTFNCQEYVKSSKEFFGHIFEIDLNKQCIKMKG